MNIITKFFKKINPFKKIIFIVEDNDVYAQSLQTFIYTRFSNIKEVKIFKTGETCLLELDRNPSIIIMDYYLNSIDSKAHNGLEIIKRIKAQTPKPNIIVLSSQENFNVVMEAVKQYDCSYLQKDQGAFKKIEELIKVIFSRTNFSFSEAWS